MIAEALEWIRQNADPVITENGDGEPVYIDHKGCAHLLPIRKDPLAEPLGLTSLQGLVDYIREGGEEDVAGTWKPFVHVVSPRKVELVSALDKHKRREIIACVDAIIPEIDLRIVEQEKLVLGAQTMFEDTEELKRLLLLAGTIKGEQVITATDDGQTQVVQASSGTKTEQTGVTNPFTLAPYRTFSDIPQPASPFFFRLHGREGKVPLMSLVPTGCVKWQQEAVESIKIWLRSRDLGLPIIG